LKFLIDRCVGRRLAEWLAVFGHDIRTSWADGQSDPGDLALLRMAADDGRILITIDSDFGTLVYLYGAIHAGFIRLPDVPAAMRIALMADLLERHGEDLPGAIVTVRGGRVRISRGRDDG
jgi:predicted nuclease of predicted toxin-antitoxin system